MSMDWLGRRVLCCPPSVRATLQLVRVVVVVVVAPPLGVTAAAATTRMSSSVARAVLVYCVYIPPGRVIQSNDIYLSRVGVYGWCMSGV